VANTPLVQLTAWLSVIAIVIAPVLPAVAQAATSEEVAAKADEAEAKQPEKKRRSWSRKSDKKKEKWGRQFEIDERTGKRLIEARELLLVDQYDAASEALGKLRMRSLNPLEKVQTYRIYAFIENGRENYAGAREYLEKILAIEDDVMTPGDRTDLRFMIAQLHLQEENWAEAAKNLEMWFQVAAEPNPAAYYILAITYYQLEDLDKALVPAQKAVDLADHPQESWLQLLLALHLTRKEYAKSVPLLDELIKRYPKKTYWVQLSTVHAAMENFQKALVPLQLAYSQGLLDRPDEVRRLAELMLFLDLPYRSAMVIEEALADNLIEGESSAYELLSNSWIAAREYEKSVVPLQRAAELSGDGEIYVRLAQVQLQREKWTEAESALQRALQKGGLQNLGTAQLLMGIVYYSQSRPHEALSWFGQATQHELTREEAQNWVKYIERELRASG
jgi:tetratricopeptide (TPR) repeat protein